MSWVDLALVVLALYLLVKIWYERRVNYYKDLGINFIKPKLLLGNSTDSILAKKHLAYTIKESYDAFPDDRYVVYFEMTQPVIVLRDRELIKNIAIRNFGHFQDHRVFISEENDVLFGKSLFPLKGDKWKQMRATMTPAFTPMRIKKMAILLHRAAEQMRKHFENKLTEESHRGGDSVLEVEGKEVFTTYFNDLMAMGGFGLEIDSFRDKETTFLQESIKMTDLHFWRFLKFVGFASIPKFMTFFKLSFIEKETVEFFRGIVVRAIAHREKENLHGLDFIDAIVQAKKGSLEFDESAEKGNSFVIATDDEKWINDKSLRKRNWTDDDLTAQATIFMIAGLDTGAASTSYLFYEMAMNPAIQKRLQKEIDDNLRIHGEFNYEVIQGMEYLNMVVTESLRKYPNGSYALDRICNKDLNIGPPRDGGKPFTVKKGEGVFISSLAVQRDPRYWPNPDKFDPERFSKENKNKIVPYTYMPFGIGPRICIGYRFGELALKLAAAYMLKTFDIIPTDKTPEVLELSPRSLTLKASAYHYGLRLRK